MNYTDTVATIATKSDVININNSILLKQEILTSKSNIKSINGQSILGSGDFLINVGIDSIWIGHDTIYWSKSGVTNYALGETFETNPTIYGTSFGKYSSGTTPNWRGLTAKQAILDAITLCLPPTYVPPNLSITASPSFGNYEIGTKLTVNLSSNFIQNDAGVSNSSAFYQNSTLTSSSLIINSLTSAQSFYTTQTYSQGLCKTNNCGVVDCSGRIDAGTVTSSSSYYVPMYKRYWGVCAGPQPTIDEILEVKGGASELSNTLSKGAFSISVPSDKYYYIFYVYLSSWGSVKQIKDNNGLDITALFVNGSSPFESQITNAQNFPFNAKIYVSANAYKNTSFGFTSIN
jgi:hypothetical protein